MVRRLDVCGLEPLEGRHFLVVLDCCLEEVNDFLVLLVGGAVARGVKGRETGGVFAEFVTPEPWIKLVDLGMDEEGETYPALSWFWAIQYVFMYSKRSAFPNGSRKVPMLGPVYFGTGVPAGVPVVVFGDGMGSYWRVRSQYCV